MINWFKQIKNKSQHKFVVFDVKEFYPSIKQNQLTKALEYAKQRVDINTIDYNTIMHARKSLVYCNDTPRMKKDSGLFVLFAFPAFFQMLKKKHRTIS